MPIGLGGSINLGSATAFLFVDATGMRRGLLQAERAMQNFQRKQASTAEALRKSASADMTRSFAVGARGAATSPAMIKLEQRVAQAADIATARIKKSYDDRNKAMAANAVAAGRAQAKIVKLEAHTNELLAERAKQQKRLDDIRNTLKLPGTDPRRPVAGSRQEARLVAELKSLRGASGSIKQLSAEINKARATIKTYQRDIQTAASVASTAVIAANRKETLSINVLEGALKKQAQAYRSLASTAGPQFEKLAEAAERSGSRLVRAMQNQAKAQRDLETSRKVRAKAQGTPDFERAVKAEENAARRLKTAVAQQINARRAHERSERNFTQKFEAEATRRIADANREAKAVAEARQREADAAKQAQEVGLQRGFGALTAGALAATAVIGVATKAWVGYEQQLFNVASISQGMLTDIDAVKEHIDHLAVSLGKSPEELAAGLYDIAQAGIQGQDAFDILDIAAQSAVAGMTDVETAARPLIGVLNAYGEEAYTAAQASDILFAAVTDGVFSFEDLSSQLGDNLSTATAMGISLEELAAAYVVLTRRSNSLAESTTQVNAIINSFTKPSEALEEAFRGLTGQSATLFFRTHDLGEVFAVVNQLFKENADAAGKLFPNLRAIRGVFGLTAGEAQKFAEELEVIKGASDGVGRRTAVLNVQMKAVAFQLSQAKEQGRQALITLGQQLAPGILLAAKAGARLATVLGTVLGALHGLGGILVGGGGAFLIAAAGIARFVSFLQEGIAGIKAFKNKLNDLRKNVIANARAMAILRFAINPLVLGAAALAVGIALVVKHWRDHNKAVKDTAQAYRDLDATIAALKSSRDFTVDQTAAMDTYRAKVDQVIANNEALNEIWDEAAARAVNLNEATVTVATGMDEAGNAINVTTIKLSDFLKMMDSTLGESGKKKLAENLNALFQVSGLDFDALQKRLNELFAQVFSGAISPDALNQAIADLVVDPRTIQTAFTQSKNALADLGDELVNVEEFFGSAADKADAFRQGMKSIVDAAEIAHGALIDFSSPLTAANGLLGTFGETAIQVIARAGKLGAIQIAPDLQQAVDLLAQMDAIQGKIDEVSASIEQNSQKMGEWQNIISLVSDTVGTAANDYALLRNLLDRGKITQQQFNDVQKAAIYLNEQAKLGIEDERTAMALSLVPLAKFVAKHETLRQQYAGLDEDVKAAATALQDQKTQALLLLAVLVKLAEILNPDAWPTEFTTKFFADVSQADPAAAALIDRYGLIPAELKTDIVLNPTDAIDTLAEVDAAIAKEKQNIVDLTAGRPSDSRDTAISRAEERIKRLTERRHDIEIGVVGPTPDEIPSILSGIKDAEDLGQDSVNALADAWTSAFDDMTQSTDETSIAVAQAIPELLRAAGAVQDFSDPMAFLTKNMHGFSNSIEDVLLNAEHLNGSALNFTASERSALRLSGQLKETEARIEHIDGVIQNNQDDMSMWENRIQLVDDTLGDSTDTLSQYQQALAEGRITQEEYNDAVASGEAHEAFANLKQLRDTDRISEKEYQDILKAGIWLRERAVGGVLDERAEIAKSLPFLAKYIKHHDTLDGKYKKLTDEQQGFIAAVNDEHVQAALSTALMLKELEKQGIAAKGVADKYLQAVAASDPAVAAFLEDVGLLDGEHEVIIDIQLNREDQAAVDALDAQLGQLTAQRASVRVQLQADPGNVELMAQLREIDARTERLRRAKAVVFVEAATGKSIEELDGIEKVVLRINEEGQLEITGDASDANRVLQELAKAGIDPKTVVINSEVGTTPQQAVDDAVPPDGLTVPATVDVDTSDITVDGTSTPAVQDQSFKVDADVAPALATMDQFQAELLTRMTNIAQLANVQGGEIGTVFTNAMAAAIIAGAGNVEAAATFGPVGAVARAGRVIRVFGGNVGLQFDFGVAEGIYNGIGVAAIERAARYVATIAYVSAMLALLARSPSRKGMIVGQSFTQGVAMGILSGQQQTIDAAKRVANATSDAFRANIASGDIASMHAGKALPVSRSGGPTNASAPSNHNTVINLDVAVNGAGNPQETAKAVTDEVWQMLHGSFVTMEARTRR